MSSAAFFCLNSSLVIDIFVPLSHEALILVTDDEVVNDPRVTLPEDLNSVGAYRFVGLCQRSIRFCNSKFSCPTWLLKTNNIRHIRHVDSTLQLKTGLALDCCRLVFTHQLGLLLIWVDILAAKQNTFEEINVILSSQIG